MATKSSPRSSSMAELRARLKEISHLGVIQGLLSWDQEVAMPSKAADIRAASLAELSAIMHQKFVALDHDGLLSRLHDQLVAKKLKGDDAVIVRETWRSFEREAKLPENLVREMAEVTSKAQTVWARAREKNDFSLFLPYLTKIVILKRKEAEYVGFKDSPYDALLDSYEPGMTTQEASIILNDLKDFLLPFLKELQARQKRTSSSLYKGRFPLPAQAAFNQYLAKTIGFDLEAGRLDPSTHPFTSGSHPYDVRITTRYKEDNLLYAIGSTIHETGHALYEQGLSVAHFGTPLAETVSLGIHESQSRMWENQIGSSLPFWKFFYPKLQKEFPVPFKKVPLKDFYRSMNIVTPSLIRTEADEVTYNLHIIIRFEIEKEMIEGAIEIKDLPQIWRAKMKEYLGVEVDDDAHGVLQDVHWSSGYIGYFPTYSFGNLYAAQFFAAMRKDIPRCDDLMSKGQFDEVRAWLREKIHTKGKRYSAGELVRKVTGEPLTSKYFADYLMQKYTNLS